jgi:hypothetical protein
MPSIFRFKILCLIQFWTLRIVLRRVLGRGADMIRRSIFGNDNSTSSLYRSGSRAILWKSSLVPTLTNRAPGKAASNWTPFPIDREIRLSSNAVIRPIALTNESLAADENETDIRTEAFFQAWINARPSLSLLGFIEAISPDHPSIVGQPEILLSNISWSQRQPNPTFALRNSILHTPSLKLSEISCPYGIGSLRPWRLATMD